jgi:hypothetical protein
VRFFLRKNEKVSQKTEGNVCFIGNKNLFSNRSIPPFSGAHAEGAPIRYTAQEHSEKERI